MTTDVILSLFFWITSKSNIEQTSSGHNITLEGCEMINGKKKTKFCHIYIQFLSFPFLWNIESLTSLMFYCRIHVFLVDLQKK